eukprot:1168105-Prymnesium_polylepis.1
MKLGSREARVAAREAAVADRETKALQNEQEVEARALEVQQWHQRRQDEERRKSANAAAFSAAYHVQAGSMTGQRFTSLVSSVQELSGLSAERFVEAKEGTQYPLVLLFLSSGGPRLTEIVKDDAVRRCREMVAPGGHLVLAPFRMGVNPQAAMGAPAGVDTLLELAYVADLGGTKPHELVSSDKSAMNRLSAGTIQQLIARYVPSPPAPLPSRLFSWLRSALSGADTNSRQEL